MIIPFRKNYSETVFLNQSGKVSLITLVLIVISYFCCDQVLAQYFAHPADPLYRIAHFLTNLIAPKVHYFLWPLVFFFIRFVLKKQALANRALLCVVSIPLANLIVEVLKLVLGRARPEMLLSRGLFGFEFFTYKNAFLSFPSGHACTAGVLMGALACFHPRYSYYFLGLGLALGATRVVLNEHYLSDVLAGLLIGILTAQWAYVVMKRENIAFVSKK